jgi:hypothetical protein
MPSWSSTFALWTLASITSPSCIHEDVAASYHGPSCCRRSPWLLRPRRSSSRTASPLEADHVDEDRLVYADKMVERSALLALVPREPPLGEGVGA